MKKKYNLISFRPLLILICFITKSTIAAQQPHMVYILVDDMGWNDVSFHGSNQIITGNIDTLAARGVVIQQHYSEAICTPTRSALLTGKFPLRTGMYGIPLSNSEDRCLPLNEKLLPSYLKELGYSTHLVGKWHVGMSREECLPLNRGFDTHYGVHGGFIDSYNYFKVETLLNGKELDGMDLFDGDIPQVNETRYIVDALTDRATSIIANHNPDRPLFLQLTHTAPHAGNDGASLQPPLQGRINNQHIANPNRRLYAEIVTYLDKAIGKVVKALDDKGILQDTIIVFLSDNGAPTVGQYSNWGVNLPFRGKKQTPWEGGVRVPALIWYSKLKPSVWNGVMHVTDWLPTLIAAAGGKVPDKIDGINQWDSLLQNGNSKRKDVVVAVEDVYAAYRLGDYKIVIGNVSGVSNGYYGAQYLVNKSPPPDYFDSVRSSDVAKIFQSRLLTVSYNDFLTVRKATTIRQIDKERDLNPCEPTPVRGCLYNVALDPSESHDLWDRGQQIAAMLVQKLGFYLSMKRQRQPVILDERADPANFDYIWQPWLNDTVPLKINNGSSVDSNTLISSGGRICDNVRGVGAFLCMLRTMF